MSDTDVKYAAQSAREAEAGETFLCRMCYCQEFVIIRVDTLRQHLTTGHVYPASGYRSPEERRAQQRYECCKCHTIYNQQGARWIPQPPPR